MPGPAAQLAGRLAREAEAVCRHYLSHGRRAGRYWQVGDVHNTPGRSLYVRLVGPASGPGAAGHWTDAATGEHGDLLDLIALNRDHRSLSETLAEARRFLGLPRPIPSRSTRPAEPRGSVEAARLLFAAGQPVAGTLAEVYLRARGITAGLAPGPLRYHPACLYRLAEDRSPESWPALLAAVTDGTGLITGLLRTWLARDGTDKAPLAEPRRAMGNLLGHGVRFGGPGAILAAGEGIETMLSLRSALPSLPCVAALSAAHLAALHLPDGLRRLYLARDADPAGHRAAARLAARAVAAGIKVYLLNPVQGDFNDDLRASDVAAQRACISTQLTPVDLDKLLP